MDTKVYFYQGHGEPYSKSKQTVSSVPKNKTLIIISQLGDVLTYSAADKLIQKYFHTQEGVDAFIKGAAKEKGFKILSQGEQFVDTVIQFYDTGVWTGAAELPDQRLRDGIFGQQANMSISPKRLPPKARMSTIISQKPNKKEIYIIFSCRGVKSVPDRYITSSGKRVRTSLMTEKQFKDLESAKKENQRKAIIRKRETPILRKSKTTQPPTKKRKTSPFSSFIKGLVFTMGRFTPSKTRKTKK